MGVRSSPLRPCVGVVLAAFIGCTAQARSGSGATTPRETLERMVHAMRTTSYVGVFVYRQGAKSMETLRLVHRGGANGGQERLYSLNGSAREVIRDSNRVTFVLPDSSSVMVERHQASTPVSRLLSVDLDALIRHYTLTMSGPFRIAGREAKRVHIEAGDAYRYGYRFWVDKATGLMLGADVLDDGRVREQLVFTDLKLPDRIPDSLLESRLSGEGYTWYEGSPPEHGEFTPRWRVKFIPPGFELQLSERRPMPGGADMPVEHQMYSDGLAAISVYVSVLANKQSRFEGLSRMGAFSVYGRVQDGHQIVVVGEVPPSSVIRMAQSVRLTDNGSVP